MNPRGQLFKNVQCVIETGEKYFQIRLWNLAAALDQIILKKLVPNHQTNSKNIFERKKRDGAITSTFGPIINLTYCMNDLDSSLFSTYTTPPPL